MTPVGEARAEHVLSADAGDKECRWGEANLRMTAPSSPRIRD